MNRGIGKRWRVGVPLLFIPFIVSRIIPPSLIMPSPPTFHPPRSLPLPYRVVSISRLWTVVCSYIEGKEKYLIPRATTHTGVAIILTFHHFSAITNTYTTHTAFLLLSITYCNSFRNFCCFGYVLIYLSTPVCIFFKTRKPGWAIFARFTKTPLP